LNRLPPNLRDGIIEHELRLRMQIGRPVKLVPEERFTGCCERAFGLLGEHDETSSLGDYVEFGVYAGTSMISAFRALERLQLHHVRLLGFDSFQGLPPTASDDDDGYWTPGMFKSDVERVRRRLARAGIAPGRAQLVPGWFDETLTARTRERVGLRKASLIMMDADLYTSTKTAFEFCLPAIHDAVVVLFDDWWPDLAARNLGETRAFDEFRAAHPEFVVTEFDAYKPEARAFLLTRGG
jgi:hypothetical protein